MISLFSLIPSSFSAEVTLAWDPNTDPDLSGYNIYYKSGSSGTPYDGIGADQGDSGINVPIESLVTQDSPSYLLTGLPDGETYYFVITAVNISGIESGYSNEIMYESNSTVVTYAITSSSEPNGSITPVGTTTVTQGANQTYSISPDSNYHIKDVQVDSVSVGPLSEYIFSNVMSDHDIHATFEADHTIVTHSITSSCEANGSISPVGSLSVEHGSSQIFTISSAPGYSIADVVVDGASMGAVTSYSFTNIVTNHTISASFDMEKQAPIADAGPDQSVESGVVVSLKGSNSIDLDDGIASFLWEQVSGLPVGLVVEPGEPDADFMAPEVESNGESLTFELTVTDYSGLQSTDTCIVNVSWVNVPPASDSGADQTVDEGTTVTLDSSKSSDADDSIVLYLWKQVSGIPVTLSDTTAIQSTFTAPQGITETESFEFNLTVEDGGGLQSSDSCVVSVTPVIQKQLPALNVSSISVRLDKKGKNYKAIASVTITTDSGNLIEGASVIVNWAVNGNYLSTSSSSTNSEGNVTLVSNPIKVKSGDIFSISISEIVKDGFLYNPINNSESITVP